MQPRLVQPGVILDRPEEVISIAAGANYLSRLIDPEDSAYLDVGLALSEVSVVADAIHSGTYRGTVQIPLDPEQIPYAKLAIATLKSLEDFAELDTGLQMEVTAIESDLETKYRLSESLVGRSLHPYEVAATIASATDEQRNFRITQREMAEKGLPMGFEGLAAVADMLITPPEETPRKHVLGIETRMPAPYDAGLYAILSCGVS